MKLLTFLINAMKALKSLLYNAVNLNKFLKKISFTCSYESFADGPAKTVRFYIHKACLLLFQMGQNFSYLHCQCDKSIGCDYAYFEI